MFISLAFVFIFGMTFGWLVEKLRLPRLVGMLLTGILLGPFVCNLLDPALLSVSAELRKLALIVVLIKAGLSLDIRDLKIVGRPALLMAFVPALFEIVAVIALAPVFLDVTLIEAAVLGTVLAAVSPAVVVPKMVALMEDGYGTKKSIPQMILAGASLDDVFVIVLFTVFVGVAQGDAVSVWRFVDIPVSIGTGLVLGVLTGFLLTVLFARLHMRDSKKVILLLGVSFVFVAAEHFLKDIVPVSGLLAVMGMALMIQAKRKVVADRLSQKFSKLWVAAEIVLFVLVGAAVDIRFAAQAGLNAALLLCLVLIVRTAGVFLCLLRTRLNMKERLFCVFSYLPKATVQAAIGGVPLALGLSCGQVVLTVAVLAILITAPLGAFLMDVSYKRLLEQAG